MPKYESNFPICLRVPRCLRACIVLVLCLTAVCLSAIGGPKSIQASALQGSLQVNGTKIVDSQGQQVLLRGFNLWESNIFDPWQFSQVPLTVERFQQLKTWGFNVVRTSAWWGRHIEPSRDQEGVYSETDLTRLENVVKAASDAGMYVVVSIRVSIGPDATYDGWAEPSDLLTPNGLERYCNMLRMIVNRFDHYTNVIGYCPWHFPWHGYSRIESNVQAYYNTITPAIINAIRGQSAKIILYSPYAHAIRPMSSQYPWAWDTGEYGSLIPVNDPLNNVVYTHDGHRPMGVELQDKASSDEKLYDYPDWSGDLNLLGSQIQYAKAFRDKYNVPIMLAEFGLMIHGSPELDARPIRQSRLDCLDAKLTTLDQLGDYNWLYYLYSSPEVEAGVLEPDLSPSAVVPILQKHLSGSAYNTVTSSLSSTTTTTATSLSTSYRAVTATTTATAPVTATTTLYQRVTTTQRSGTISTTYTRQTTQYVTSTMLSTVISASTRTSSQTTSELLKTGTTTVVQQSTSTVATGATSFVSVVDQRLFIEQFLERISSIVTSWVDELRKIIQNTFVTETIKDTVVVIEPQTYSSTTIQTTYSTTTSSTSTNHTLTSRSTSLFSTMTTATTVTSTTSQKTTLTHWSSVTAAATYTSRETFRSTLAPVLSTSTVTSMGASTSMVTQTSRAGTDTTTQVFATTLVSGSTSYVRINVQVTFIERLLEMVTSTLSSWFSNLTRIVQNVLVVETVRDTVVKVEPLKTVSLTVTFSDSNKIHTKLSLEYTHAQQGMGSATKFYGWLKEKDSGDAVAGERILLTVMGGGSAWTYTLTTDSQGYYELIYANNNGIFDWAEARFDADSPYLSSSSGRLRR